LAGIAGEEELNAILQSSRAHAFMIAEPLVSPAALVAGMGLYGVHLGTLRWGRAAWANPMALRPSPAARWFRYALPRCLENLLF
jgi:hypothetical protein